MGARDGRAVEPLADPVAGAAYASSEVVLHGRGMLVPGGHAEDLEVTVGDPCDRVGRDRGSSFVELRGQPVEDVPQLLVVGERKAALADELGVAAAASVRRGQAAGERLEKGVGARVVAARGDVEVLGAEEVGERVRVEGPDGANPFEAQRRPPREGHLVAGVIEVRVEPGERLAALPRVVRPARRDHPHSATVQGFPARGPMEDRGIDRVRDHDGVA